MSDLERVLSEAQRAREEAEAAAQRATDLEAQAEAARERARQEQEQRRRDWAKGILDSYESDLTAAETNIETAQQHFETAAVEDLPGAVAAYLAWGQAAVDHYTLQVRAGTAAPLSGYDASPAEFASPPPFSQALDQALSRRLGDLSDQARDRAADEVNQVLNEGEALETS